MRDSRLESSVFGVAPPKPAAKSDITTLAAWAIINAEAEQRNAKTERLRAARLAMTSSALAALPVIPVKRVRMKAGRVTIKKRGAAGVQ